MIGDSVLMMSKRAEVGTKMLVIVEVVAWIHAVGWRGTNEAKNRHLVVTA